MGLQIESLAAAAADPRTPPDELQDINQQRWQLLQSALAIPNLDDVREEIAPFLWGADYLTKATRLEPYTSSLEVDGYVTGRGHTSILNVNEFGVVTGKGNGASRWVEPPVIGGHAFLRYVVESNEVLKAIINTRVRQVLRWCQPERDGEPEGFHFVRRDREKLTKDDLRECDRIEQWILNCGDEPDPRRRKRLRRDDMEGFVSKLIRDSLTGDGAPIETEMSRNRKTISGLYSVPFDTVRLCTEDGYEGDDEICAAQVIDGVAHCTYGYEDLIYEVRNPRTDLAVNGYGYAEPEMIIRVLTAYTNSFNYNESGLSKNTAPRGILFMPGGMQRREMQAFARQVDAMLKGGMNRHTIPMVASPDVEKAGSPNYIKLDEFNEMMFIHWMTFLVSTACAVYSIDPGEIHHDSFSARSSSPLSGNDTAEKIAHSRDKGLLPLLKYIKRIYNQFVIPLLSPKYRLEFTGLDEEDKQLKEARLMATSTVDEIRELDGREAHPDELIGSAPTNQMHLMLYAQSKGLTGGAEDPAGGGGGGGDQVDEDEDYATDADGQHAPYANAGGQAPTGPHLHTIALGGNGGAAKGKRKARGAPAAPMAKAEQRRGFIVIDKRGRDAA